MKPKVLSVFFYLIFSGVVISRTVEERTFRGLVTSFKLFNLGKNDVPRDWLSLREFGFDITLKDARDILDVENRYFFPNLHHAFSSRFNTKRHILLMAKRPGEEGDIKIYKTATTFDLVKARFVIFKNAATGEIESGKIPEKELQTMFAKEGLNLESFTFTAPKKPDVSFYTNGPTRIEHLPNHHGVGRSYPNTKHKEAAPIKVVGIHKINFIWIVISLMALFGIHIIFQRAVKNKD